MGATVQVKPVCRQCFAQYGYSQPLAFNESTKEYVCKKDMKHRYKKEEDGTLTSL